MKLKVPIFFYHKIGTPADDASNPHLYVPLENFTAQMRYLSRHGYNTLTLSELSRALDNKIKLPRRSVIITFDDGHLDNYENAFPVLEQYNLKATIFVVSDFIGQEANWQSKEKVSEPLVSWNQIYQMQKKGITFASHTCTHPMLNKIPLDEARNEITVSREKLEQGLGTSVESFCYPYGEFSQEVATLVKEAGYKAACITDHGNCHSREDVYQLKRVFVWPDTPLWRFIYYLSRFYDFEKTRKHRRKAARRRKKL